MSDPIALERPQATALINTGETAATAVAAQAKALVEARYLIAIRQPRDLDTVREKLMKECRRPSFAEVARYSKPIGKGVVGPSIRFAEAALRYMGNVHIPTATIYDDREKRIIRVMVLDLETNVGYDTEITIEKTVERKQLREGQVPIRSRYNSENKLVYIVEATEDDLLNKTNALISKAIRTNGLRVVPGDIVDECMDLVVETQKAKDAADPDAAKRKVFDNYATIGVTVDQIKTFLGHGGDVLAPKELADLRALYSAIKDGETTWREAIESVAHHATSEKPAPVEVPKGGSKTQAMKQQMAANKTEPEQKT